MKSIVLYMRSWGSFALRQCPPTHTIAYISRMSWKHSHNPIPWASPRYHPIVRMRYGSPWVEEPLSSWLHLVLRCNGAIIFHYYFPDPSVLLTGPWALQRTGIPCVHFFSVISLILQWNFKKTDRDSDKWQRQPFKRYRSREKETGRCHWGRVWPLLVFFPSACLPDVCVYAGVFTCMCASDIYWGPTRHSVRPFRSGFLVFTIL